MGSANRKRKKILKYTKGFRWGRRTKERAAKEALVHAWSHAFRGRKERKRTARTLWQAQINIAAKNEGVSYSKFIYQLKEKKIGLDRKILAELANKEPKIFKKILESVK